MKKLVFLAIFAFGLLNLQIANAEEKVKTAPDSMKCSELPADYSTPAPWEFIEKYNLLLGDDPSCEIRIATFAEGSKCIPVGYVGGAQRVLIRAKGKDDDYLKVAVCSRDGMRDSAFWGVGTDGCAWDPWFCIWTDHEWDKKIKKDWY